MNINGQAVKSSMSHLGSTLESAFNAMSALEIIGFALGIITMIAVFYGVIYEILRHIMLGERDKTFTEIEKSLRKNGWDVTRLETPAWITQENRIVANIVLRSR